ncbi:leucine-rich single-pass membrane protein 2 isoform X2 [Coturnix japonica]|uniref:leucine-rich single-pass membrane protein 2 isoform X2 n=1 Tax=Coturnix japonica TaxID=93934 RepID=UPI000776C50B|nr:leucine-rich single-pass membrane protein 2 isoform X2 [Coturnix japonica]
MLLSPSSGHTAPQHRALDLWASMGPAVPAVHLQALQHSAMGTARPNDSLARGCLHPQAQSGPRYPEAGVLSHSVQLPAALTRLWECGHQAPANCFDDSAQRLGDGQHWSGPTLGAAVLCQGALDGVGRAEGTVPTEPADLDGTDPGAISLHPVASISDLHWASAGHKGTEVLQSQSVQTLAQWLESQEDAMRQLRAASGQLWARLNASAQRR